MIALIAAAIGILIVFAMWRLVDSDNDRESYRTRPAPPRVPRPKFPTRARQTAPDDDPEFLRQLSSRLPKHPDTPPDNDD